MILWGNNTWVMNLLLSTWDVCMLYIEIVMVPNHAANGALKFMMGGIRCLGSCSGDYFHKI